MNWIRTSVDQWINLDNVFHIWIDKTENGYFINGELIHNSEEVVLSGPFLSIIDCVDHLNKYIGWNYQQNQRNNMKEELIKFVMEKADKYYYDDFPINSIETWIREFFDQYEKE